MKFNWGTGIAIFIALFMMSILTLVYLSFQNHPDLVSADYYEKEVNYQQTIDARKKANKLHLNMKPDAASGAVIIEFPDSRTLEAVEGTVYLYRPEKAGLDRRYEMAKLAKADKLFIPLKGLVKGQYMVKLEWKKDGTSYYWQEKLYL